MITIAIFVILLILVYKYWTSGYDTWKKRGIPCLPSRFPFGTDWKLSLMWSFQGYVQEEMNKMAENEPLFGIYVMKTPILIVKDPALIKIILVKEFSHFADRQTFKIPEKDYLSHHLFNLEGERWRALRIKLTPTFSSGKLKAMFPLFLRSSQAYRSLLMSKEGMDVDIKDLAGRFNTDIICSCAFGMDANTLNDPDCKLRNIGLNTFAPGPAAVLSTIIARGLPQLRKFIIPRLIPIETEMFILKFVNDIVHHRETNDIKRNDFIDLLIQLRDKGTLVSDLHTGKEEGGQPIEMTTELMAAQCFVFFLAGFETSSSVQTYCMYEMALNQEIQQKVKEEIDKTIEKHGDLTYEAMKEMEYLDMVISETMRKYPTVTALSRLCVRPYTTPEGHKIEVGDRIQIPLWALHHDPKFFPNPEKFDPERFSSDNKNSIIPFSYLPFGEGPRICIGVRFGLLQTKMGIVTVLKDYKIEPCESTKIPLELKASFAMTTTKNPIILKLVKRNDP